MKTTTMNLPKPKQHILAFLSRNGELKHHRVPVGEVSIQNYLDLLMLNKALCCSNRPDLVQQYSDEIKAIETKLAN